MNAALDLRDTAISLATPLVAVPRFGTLPALRPGEKRLLGAANGLFLEVRSDALHACVALNDVPMPYGPAQAFIRFAGGPLPRGLLAQFVREACASPNTEIARGLEWTGSEYVWITPRVQSQSGAHITYLDGFDDCRLVINAHSHARHGAFFSGDDDDSDSSRPGPYIALVVGHCDRLDTATVCARLVCPPYLIPLPLDAADWLA